MKRILLLIVLLFTLSSCDKALVNLITESYSSSLGLSTEELKLDSSASVSYITTKESGWVITTSFYIDDQLFKLYIPEEGEESKSGNYIAVEEGFYVTYGPEGVNEPYGEIVKIPYDWFTITKEDETTLKIEVKENTTSESRQFVLGLRACNYFPKITLSQGAN
ncbi:MAG: lipoprotein [Rikenellaceae bacterium]